jgi:hypothetical protein
MAEDFTQPITEMSENVYQESLPWGKQQSEHKAGYLTAISELII